MPEACPRLSTSGHRRSRCPSWCTAGATRRETCGTCKNLIIMPAQPALSANGPSPPALKREGGGGSVDRV
jgi:hypothetical protein